MKHNIVLIQVDQMNANCLSFLGNENVHTPNLDSIVDHGVLFQNAYCQSPICMPSRASMLSGQYPSTNRVFGFEGLGDPRTPQLVSVLKQAGYRTGAFGKFHVHNIAPSQWEMDVAACTMPEDHALACPADNTYMHYCRSKQLPWPIDQMHCHIPPQYYDKTFASRINPGPDAHPSEWYRSAVSLENSLETWTTDRCLSFLKDCCGNTEPFFIWLTYDRPHIPTTLPQPWFDRMCKRVVKLSQTPSVSELASLPRWMIDRAFKHSQFSMESVGEERFRWLLASYFTLIEFIDSEIGRVMQELRTSNLADNTTVVFTSDHGDQAGYSNIFDKQCFSASEAITRVPLIIAAAPSLGPQQPAHSVAEPVELVDLFPTLCSMNGLKIPERVEGRDLSDIILKAQSGDPDRPIFCEEYYRRVIVHHGYKLLFDETPGNEMLFNLNSDPNSFENVYNQPEYAEKRFDLKRRLLAFLCERIFGTYDSNDVERIERALDPKDPRLSLFTLAYDGDHTYSLHYHRAAVLLSDGQKYTLLVPFYDRKPVLFGWSFYYPSWDDAIEFDSSIAEHLVDEAIRACIGSVLSISRLDMKYAVE